MSKERDQDEVLARQLAKKIKLENRFKPELRRFFKQVGKNASAQWLASGRVRNLDSFELELIAMLRGHYRRVEKAFSKEARKETKAINFFLETKQEENIDNEIVDYINQHSIKQSQFILETTRRDLDAVVATTVAAAAFEVARPTNAEIAKEIRVEFDERSVGRVDTIAMTETQTPAEEIKFIEGMAVAEILRQTTGQTMVKTWNTILDERTRPSHVAADRQEVNIRQPFIVQGERLPVPGSTALGASLSNIINCRCSSINTIEGAPTTIISGEVVTLQ
jgi:hypothetical protein